MTDHNTMMLQILELGGLRDQTIHRQAPMLRVEREPDGFMFVTLSRHTFGDRDMHSCAPTSSEALQALHTRLLDASRNDHQETDDE